MIGYALKFRNAAPRLTDAVTMSVAWAVPSLFLNLAWEIAQLPLYRIPSAQVAYAIGHCTAGDVAIAVMSFLITAVVLGDTNWVASRPWRGCAIVILAGVSYTAYSEWYNVYQAGYWAYSSSMPLLFGIGLSPPLQWIFVPMVTTLIVRNRAIARRAAN